MTYCIAHGTLLNVMCPPGWEGDWEENGYMSTYGWVLQLSTWNYHSIVNQLYPNTTSYPFPSEGRQNENHNHKKITRLITWVTALSNSMKLWTMPCRATQDRRVMVESSDKTGEENGGEKNGKPLQYSCLENPMNSMRRQNDMTLKDKLPRSVGAQYATGEGQRNSSRKNEETEPKWKEWAVVDVTGDGNKVQCY